MKFERLDIIEPIIKALKLKDYSSPTPIQEKAIPIILQKKDVLGCAQTGTGKTAAFAIPIIQNLYVDKAENNKTIKSLIVTPTRELAIQIAESFTDYGKFTGIKNTVIFGGVKQGKQVNALKNGVEVLVATPGRLLDLIDQGYINLRNVKYFVLDEADRMLDMGFINDIKRIIKILPHKRQSLFFSATMPKNIVDLSNTILKNPEKIEVSPVSSTAETIQQFIYFTNKSTKRNLVLSILENKEIGQVLMFCKTKHGCDKVVKFLTKNKIKSAAIHGDKAQNQRQKALNNFKCAEIRVLVATDIAARGIDIDKLKHVINFDVPNVAETYVHRIGRSGRAGDKGTAISICEPEENIYVKDIEKLIKKKISVVENHTYPQTDKPMNTEERKKFEKEKVRKRQEFFANKKKNKSNFKRRR
jgi:ATP-dependent RNA helicase RhlE